MGALGLVTSACVTVMGQDPDSPASGAIAMASPAPSALVSAPAPLTEAPSEATTTPSEAPTPEPTEPPVETTEAPPATSQATPPASVRPEPTVSASPAPTVAPSPSEPAIGYIALDGSQAFVQAISSGMREAAAIAGMELVECDAGWKRSGVRTCARKLANAGVTGIVSMQPFGDLAEEACEATGNVPIVGIVYEQGPCQVSLLQVDQAESGRLAGAALGALAAERWDCDVKAYVSLESGADDPIGGARMQGYREGFKEHCPLPRKRVKLSDAQHLITAQTQVASVLDDVAGKPIIVAGVSDSAALGALRSARTAGRANHVWTAGQLAEPAAREAIACDKRFLASVAQFPERFGQVAVPAIVAAMDGDEVSAQLEAEMALVTAENVRELFPDTSACNE